MPISRTGQELIGIAEAAHLTGLDRRTLHRMIDKGELQPASKLPGLRGAYVLNRSDIEALAAKRTALAESEVSR